MKQVIRLIVGVLLSGSLGFFIACGTASPGKGTETESNGSSAPLASSLEDDISASGTLLCSPSTPQVDACSGEDAGSGCTLYGPDGGGNWPGTCRQTIDGTMLACAPNAPQPPAALVNACIGEDAGQDCTVGDAFGLSIGGVCVAEPSGGSLVCGRPFTPPAPLVSACDGLSAGDNCAISLSADFGWPADAGTWFDGLDDAGTWLGSLGDAGTWFESWIDSATISGVCSSGPASTGPLACIPVQTIIPSATSACSGLDAGAACSVGFGHEGTCVSPAAGGDAVCVIPCESAGGEFVCGGGGSIF